MRKANCKLLRLPPVKWDAFCRRHRESLHEISRDLDAIAESAARMAAYVSERHGAGCCDQGHVRAVKRCNSTANKVRRALGYTYPSGINF